MLDVDREYRESAQAGRLQTIVPHRFNPKKEAWLPILHTQRDSRHYTALFSNSALANQLHKTRDWVILYYEDDHGERQCTVVTGRHLPFENKRVVQGARGRMRIVLPFASTDRTVISPDGSA